MKYEFIFLLSVGLASAINGIQFQY